MAVAKFRPGDEVIVREWDDMTEEFGEAFSLIPTTGASFVGSMKKYCGRVSIVERLVGIYENMPVYRLQDCGGWNFPECSLTETNRFPDTDINADELLRILNT